jgi:nicotinate-nucleotide pyrophosphorylase (carboxylating)
MELSENIKNLIALSLKEDIGQGDITTISTVPGSLSGRGFVKAKSPGVLCGQDVFSEVFRQVDPSIIINWLTRDGETLASLDVCVKFSGSLRSILIAERTALNFLQRLSGISTLTSQYVEMIKHTKARIIDTRKTTPLWRELEKYAVRTGGGLNHRMGLYDMYLIKDNHITAAGSISDAIQRVLENNQKSGAKYQIEVETRNLAEIEEALKFPVTRIMLDNMPVDEMRKAIRLINGKCEVEASGGVSLNTVKAIAEIGVDFISVGALTHSAPAMDLSLLVEKV